MFWVLLSAAAAVAALVTLVAYGVWLAHRVGDLWSEVQVVLAQLGQLGELAASIGPSESRPGPKQEADLTTSAANPDLGRADVG